MYCTRKCDGYMYMYLEILMWKSILTSFVFCYFVKQKICYSKLFNCLNKHRFEHKINALKLASSKLCSYDTEPCSFHSFFMTNNGTKSFVREQFSDYLVSTNQRSFVIVISHSSGENHRYFSWYTNSYFLCAVCILNQTSERNQFAFWLNKIADKSIWRCFQIATDINSTFLAYGFNKNQTFFTVQGCTCTLSDNFDKAILSTRCHL